MPANGEVSTKFGTYKTLCCDAEIVIASGVVFPDCPNHPRLPTQWKELQDVRLNAYNKRRSDKALEGDEAP